MLGSGYTHASCLRPPTSSAAAEAVLWVIDLPRFEQCVDSRNFAQYATCRMITAAAQSQSAPFKRIIGTT